MREVQRSLFLYMLILKCLQLTVILILQWCILDPFTMFQNAVFFFFLTKIGDGLVLACWRLLTHDIELFSCGAEKSTIYFGPYKNLTII